LSVQALKRSKPRIRKSTILVGLFSSFGLIIVSISTPFIVLLRLYDRERISKK
jgi:hypothetical protein